MDKAIFSYFPQPSESFVRNAFASHRRWPGSGARKGAVVGGLGIGLSNAQDTCVVWASVYVLYVLPRTICCKSRGSVLSLFTFVRPALKRGNFRSLSGGDDQHKDTFTLHTPCTWSDVQRMRLAGLPSPCRKGPRTPNGCVNLVTTRRLKRKTRQLLFVIICQQMHTSPVLALPPNGIYSFFPATLKIKLNIMHIFYESAGYDEEHIWKFYVVCCYVERQSCCEVRLCCVCGWCRLLGMEHLARAGIFRFWEEDEEVGAISSMRGPDIFLSSFEGGWTLFYVFWRCFRFGFLVFVFY